jgi:hypothetical protein
LTSTPDDARLGRVERLTDDAEQRPFDVQLLADRDRPSRDPPAQVALARVDEQPVELSDRSHARDRDQMVAAKPTHFSLDPALLMCALDPWGREIDSNR